MSQNDKRRPDERRPTCAAYGGWRQESQCADAPHRPAGRGPPAGHHEAV